jgi:hypothetical protein
LSRKFRKDLPSQAIERGRMPVEPADLDRDVLEQPRRFALALAQKQQVVGERFRAHRHHAVQRTARDGWQPIGREIRPAVLAQELQDFAERWVVKSWDAGLRTSERWHLEVSPRIGWDLSKCHAPPQRSRIFTVATAVAANCFVIIRRLL